MKVKIIERKNKNEKTNQLFAENLKISVDELNDIRKMWEEREKEDERLEKMGILREYCPRIIEGQVLFYDNLQKELRKAFEYEKKQERIYIRNRVGNTRVPLRSLVRKI